MLLAMSITPSKTMLSTSSIMDILPAVTGAVCGFIASIPDSKLVQKIIPQIIASVVRFIADIPESRFVKRFIPQTIVGIVRSSPKSLRCSPSVCAEPSCANVKRPARFPWAIV